MREVQFDGLPGPTHNYAALALGNVASMKHGGRVSNPRAAALQGLAKMRFVHGLGIAQAVLPPHERPSVRALRARGFAGTDADVLSRAAREAPEALRNAASSSAMWSANAATVAPSCDTRDGRVHLVPANLSTMPHRALKAETTTRNLRAIFADPAHFVVHDPLPADPRFSDEGAANHLRLATPGHRAVHVLAWGRDADEPGAGPRRFPARQTLQASRRIAETIPFDDARARVLAVSQDARGIDGGAFHTNVLAVGNEGFLFVHELAFSGWELVGADLRDTLGHRSRFAYVTEAELPLADAVSSYVFNSQVLTLPDGSMAIVAPVDARENERARAVLERVLAEDNPVRAVHYLDVRESMDNGGGPACLRLRVPLADDEVAALGARVLVDDARLDALEAWVRRHYRERLAPDDLGDPSLLDECRAALGELGSLLGMNLREA